MESTPKRTPAKAPRGLTRSQSSKIVENLNPNFASSTPEIKCARSATRNSNSVPSPAKSGRKKTKRKPVVSQKLVAAAEDGDFKCSEVDMLPLIETTQVAADDGSENPDKKEEIDSNGEATVIGSTQAGAAICRSNIKRGKVTNLIQAFERILTLPPGSKIDDDESAASETKQDCNTFEPPNLQRVESSSSCPLDALGTPENLRLDSCDRSSWDGNQQSISRRTSGGGRRNSSGSSGTSGGTKLMKKKMKITNQKPFKLRTEQRGKVKEEELLCKIQEMMEEQERQRMQIAQGLPWTTEEPQCLIKPPVKDITRPIDVKLHTDLRAVERAEFDQQMSEKMSLFEQYKMERERHKKLAEEEEIRRLRKELVPKAQPMPYFDRPFVPKRSSKASREQRSKEPNSKHQNVRKSEACYH